MNANYSLLNFPKGFVFPHSDLTEVIFLAFGHNTFRWDSGKRLVKVTSLLKTCRQLHKLTDVTVRAQD